MSNLNLQQKALLDVSGELSPEAREALHSQISLNPAASKQYQTIKGAFSLLSLLPIPEPSAEERRRIPAAIKEALHAALAAPVKEARRFSLLIRYAILVALLAACAATFWVTWSNHSYAAQRHAEQFARINATTERIVPTVQKPTAYNLAVTDVEASIRQLQTESPTLSQVHDKSLANLLDALANVPLAEEGEEQWFGESN